MLILSLAVQAYGQKVTLSGYVKDAANGEALIGATVYETNSQTGAATNAYGFFSLTLNQGPIEITASYVGFNSLKKKVNLDADRMLELSLESTTNKLENVVITAKTVEVAKEVNSTEMGTVKLDPAEIASIPSLGGETDIIKVAQLLPGIAKGGEGQTGMYVRGGTDDQNLILLDEATVYNLGHLFGFFSVFNNDAIRDITIYKGGFPAQFGGRLSSVMDVHMDEGSLEKFSGNGGVGILSSRLSLSGPILKNKMGFMISGRRTYIDQMFKLVGQQLPYYFYDLNAKVNYKISTKDRLFLSSYFGNDVLSFSDNGDASVEVSDQESEPLNFGFQLGNFTSTLRWNHIYGRGKLFSNVTLLQTRFKYDISGKFVDNNILIKSQIQDIGVKAHWHYAPNPKHNIKFGTDVVNHAFRPNIVNTSGAITTYLKNQKGNLINTQEFGLFFNDDFTINRRLSINYGLRLSGTYTEKTFYSGVEPRLSTKYSLSKLHSLKFGYTRMKQYMHRVTSSSVALPTDLWYPVTSQIKPQDAHQVALGYFGGIEKAKLNYSVEGYYKYMSNLIEYKEGAQLLLNNNFEDELLSGNGESYGVEFLLRRKTGKIKGWIAYTLSWSKRNFDGLNNGNTYYAKYDRRHSLAVVGMFELSERLTFSTVWEYNTGSRFTAQNGQYLMPNSSLTAVETVPLYTERNGVVLAPTHRLDLNLVLKSKQTRRLKGEWHFGVYNFYNRAAPYRVNLEFTSYGYRYVQPGLFGLIPSVAYNFKF